MAQRGAKHLILLSRSGPRSEAAQELLQDLLKQKVEVEAPPCDISNMEALSTTLAALAEKMPPIKGCIQSSMLLKDSPFEHMSYERWTSALEPKVQGTRNLDTLLPRGMDFFIMFSSIAGAIGSTTQANYSAGCSFQDALAHHRVGRGEKATTLNLGMMLEEGALVENARMLAILQSTGFLVGITQRELFALLERHCDPSAGISTPLETQIVLGFEIPANLKAKGIYPPTFMCRPYFRHCYAISSESVADRKEDAVSDEANLTSLISKVTSYEEAAGTISEALKKKLSKVLGVPLEDMDSSKPMHVYGVDSLVAVELRNWFSKTVQADVAIFEILGNTTFEDIGRMVSGKSRVVLARLATLGSEGDGLHKT